MQGRLFIVLLALTFSGCAANVSQGGSEASVAEAPVVSKHNSAKPSSPKPPVIVSRIEPALAVQKVIAQAVVARKNGNYDQALLLLDRAQRMAPKAAEVYLEMARVNRQTGRLAQAEQLCLKAISLSGSDQDFRRQAMRELEYVRRARSA
jgi:thioredoxin-like negative regulator of GroEL